MTCGEIRQSRNMEAMYTDRTVKRDRAEIWRIYVWTEQSNEIEFVGQE